MTGLIIRNPKMVNLYHAGAFPRKLFTKILIIRPSSLKSPVLWRCQWQTAECVCCSHFRIAF